MAKKKARKAGKAKATKAAVSVSPAPAKKAARPAKPAPLKLLKRASQNSLFYLADGRTLADLRELALALGDMAHEIFSHHANHERNDFANWVAEVFKEPELAETLRSAGDRTQAQVVVLTHLVRKL